MGLVKGLKQNHNKGFTLSEVLITLVIIGIIAAITVPAISRSSEKYILKNQFKKAYSAILTAMQKADKDLGGNTGCYYSIGGGSGANGECNILFEQMTKNLNIQKRCNGNAKRDGCIPDPYMKYYPTAEGVSGINQENTENRNTVYNLSDGTIIMLWNFGTMPLFMIDINGAKGPNTMGKDIFAFIIESDGINGLRMRDSVSPYAKSSDRWFKKISDIYKE